MESKTRYVLKHTSGLYFSPEATESRQLTRHLFHAKRFYSEEQYQMWLGVSPYVPDKPEDFTLIPVVMTIEEVQNDVQEIAIDIQSGSRAS